MCRMHSTLSFREGRGDIRMYVHLFVVSKRNIERINQQLIKMVTYKARKGSKTEDISYYIVLALERCQMFYKIFKNGRKKESLKNDKLKPVENEKRIFK